MASYNRIILVGNLTRDPQLSYLPSQTPVCEFGIATNERWRDKDGNNHEDVCFIDCKLFGRGAEVFCQYMTKGRPVLVEGKLKLDQWTSQDGEKKSKHRVFVENFTFLGGQGGGGPGGGGQGEGNYAPRSQPATGRGGAPAGRGASPAGRGSVGGASSAPARNTYAPPAEAEPSYEEESFNTGPREEPPF